MRPVAATQDVSWLQADVWEIDRQGAQQQGDPWLSCGVDDVFDVLGDENALTAFNLDKTGKPRQLPGGEMTMQSDAIEKAKEFSQAFRISELREYLKNLQLHHEQLKLQICFLLV